MRHQCKKHKLGRPDDQRKALMRSLASSLFMHGEIKTTMAKAKALKPYAEHVVTLAKKGDLHSRRQSLKFIYDRETGNTIELDGKEIPETISRKLFSNIAKDYADRKGGYTRIFRLPPRRGDASEMALIQLV